MNLPSQDFLLLNCWQVCLKYARVKLTGTISNAPPCTETTIFTPWLHQQLDSETLIFTLKTKCFGDEAERNQSRKSRTYTYGTYPNYFAVEAKTGR